MTLIGSDGGIVDRTGNDAQHTSNLISDAAMACSQRVYQRR